MAVDQLSKNCVDGTTLGQTATDKVGFWGATPIVQPTNANQAAAGTTASTTTSPAGYTTTTQATNLALLVDAMRTALVNAGIMKGS